MNSRDVEETLDTINWFRRKHTAINAKRLIAEKNVEQLQTECDQMGKWLNDRNDEVGKLQARNSNLENNWDAILSDMVNTPGFNLNAEGRSMLDIFRDYIEFIKNRPAPGVQEE